MLSHYKSVRLSAFRLIKRQRYFASHCWKFRWNSHLDFSKQTIPLPWFQTLFQMKPCAPNLKIIDKYRSEHFHVTSPWPKKMIQKHLWEAFSRRIQNHVKHMMKFFPKIVNGWWLFTILAIVKWRLRSLDLVYATADMYWKLIGKWVASGVSYTRLNFPKTRHVIKCS